MQTTNKYSLNSLGYRLLTALKYVSSFFFLTLYKYELRRSAASSTTSNLVSSLSDALMIWQSNSLSGNHKSTSITAVALYPSITPSNLLAALKMECETNSLKPLNFWKAIHELGSSELENYRYPLDNFRQASAVSEVWMEFMPLSQILRSLWNKSWQQSRIRR